MSLKSKWIRGSLVFYEGHQKRLLDAIGSNVVKWSSDFVTIAEDDWTLTVVDGGTDEADFFGVGDGSGGFLRIVTNDADNDGTNAQLGSEAFVLTPDNELYFGLFGVSVNDVTQSDFFAGLAVTDTDILGGVTDSIGFRNVDASAALNYLVEKNSTETTAAIATLANSTRVDLEFFWSGKDNTLEFFVNGVSVAAPVLTNLPDDEALRISLHCLTGEAAAKTFLFDRLTVIQIGR
jgi:hypothetical protein